VADTSWVSWLVRRAERVVALYGDPHSVPYALLQAHMQREQERIRTTQAQVHQLRLDTVRPLYRQLHPQRYLESLQGVGQDSAAIFIAFIGDILRFPSLRDFRGWSGLIPFSRQSGDAQAKGLHITKAGPDLVKATAFLDAACATHLLDRIYAILRDNRPYQLRDVDGTPIDKHQARRICQERYQVPDQVRRRNNHRVRQARKERRMERRFNRRKK